MKKDTKKEKIFAANWKMYLTPSQAVQLAHRISTTLLPHINDNSCNIILCPSFSALPLIKPIIDLTTIQLGAQNCSHNNSGAHTGEESVQTLIDLHCAYCIVGHSERRHNNHESNDLITQKALQLLLNNITPIICVGETIDEFNNKQTQAIITQQLRSLFDKLNDSKTILKQSIYIAYEPVWAIGSGLIPDKNYLFEIFEWLNEICSDNFKNMQWKLLYGGSVNSEKIKMLASVDTIDGFLIGSSSLDFQEFEKIVCYTN